jgi:hypothetical protein
MGISRSSATITAVSYQQNQPHSSEGKIEYPRLKCQVSLYSDSIIFSQNNSSYRLPCQPHIIPGLQTLLLRMNGHHHLQVLQQQFSPDHPKQINILIQQLANRGLIEDGKNTVSDLRQSSILKWEELFAEHLSKKLQQQSLHFFAAFPPANISYGFALEYYHLLSHSSQFYTSLLHFQDSTKIRHHLNRFYCKINRQDELLFQGLQGLGISQEDLAITLPLPETMALSNALTFWANSDPLLCISLLAIWEVQLIQTWEGYLSQLNSASIDGLFLAAAQQFIQLKSEAQPEGLKHIIISELSPFEDAILERFKCQIHLFLELNHNFHIALGNYYSSNSHLLRQLSIV